jgi:hypothetical protein
VAVVRGQLRDEEWPFFAPFVIEPASKWGGLVRITGAFWTRCS